MFWGNDLACSTLAAAGLTCRPIELERVASWLEAPERRLALLVANFRSATVASRGFRSWQGAVKAMDRRIVEAVAKVGGAVEGDSAVVGDPAEYAAVAEWIANGKGIPMAERVRLATRALEAVAEFYGEVGGFLEMNAGEVPDVSALSGFPRTLSPHWKREAVLRGGENPHQKAALYGAFSQPFELLHGGPLGYQGLVDLSTAVFLIGEFQKPACVLVQNGDVLAAGAADRLEDAWEKLDREELASFQGGVVAVNVTLQSALAEKMADLRGATVLGPTYAQGALERLKRGAGARVLTTREGLSADAMQQLRSVAGGLLVQDLDRASVNPFEWVMPTRAQPPVDAWSDMLFAVKVSRHARSSCIVAARGERIIRICRGEPSQLHAWRRLMEGDANLGGSSVAFDQTLGDPGWLEELGRRGVAVVLHAGLYGSAEERRECLRLADDAGLVLVETGRSYRRG